MSQEHVVDIMTYNFKGVEFDPLDVTGQCYHPQALQYNNITVF